MLVALVITGSMNCAVQLLVTLILKLHWELLVALILELHQRIVTTFWILSQMKQKHHCNL